MKKSKLLLLTSAIAVSLLNGCTQEDKIQNKDVKTGVNYIDEKVVDLMSVKEQELNQYIGWYFKLLPNKDFKDLTQEEQMGLLAFTLESSSPLTKDQVSLYGKRMFGEKSFKLKEGNFTIGDQHQFSIDIKNNKYYITAQENTKTISTSILSILGVENGVLKINANVYKDLTDYNKQNNTKLVNVLTNQTQLYFKLNDGYIQLDHMEQVDLESAGFDKLTNIPLIDYTITDLTKIDKEQLSEYLKYQMMFYVGDNNTSFSNEEMTYIAALNLHGKVNAITNERVKLFVERYFGVKDFELKEGTFKVPNEQDIQIKQFKNQFATSIIDRDLDSKFVNRLESFDVKDQTVIAHYTTFINTPGIAYEVIGRPDVYLELVDGHLIVKKIQLPTIDNKTGVKWVDQPVTLSKITKEDLTSYLDILLTAYYDKNISEFTYEQILTTAYIKIHGFDQDSKNVFTSERARIFAERYFGVKDFKVKEGKYKLLDLDGDGSYAYVTALDNQYFISMCECEIWEPHVFKVKDFNIKGNDVVVHIDVEDETNKSIGNTTVSLELINGHLIVKKMEYKPL